MGGYANQALDNVADIGFGLAKGIGFLAQLTGNGDQISQAVDNAEKQYQATTRDIAIRMGLNPDSTAYGAGRITNQVVTTVMPGGGLALAAKATKTVAGKLDDAARAATRDPKTLFHFTDEKGLAGILESGKINPSTKEANPKDARYGDGQYFSDVAPGTRTDRGLAATFVGRPAPNKYTPYVEVDVSGLNISKGRAHVFVHRSKEALDITRRIVSSGAN